MNTKKNYYQSVILLIIVIAIYRVIPTDVQGMMPLLSICLFSGFAYKNKKLAILIPISIMVLSDLFFYVLHKQNLTAIEGVYSGQILNYLLLAGVVLFGSVIKKITIKRILGFSISSSLMYFIASNFVVWITHTGFSRPLSFSGLMMCYNDAILFYRNFGLIKGFDLNFMIGSLIWSIILFGIYDIFFEKNEIKNNYSII